MQPQDGRQAWVHPTPFLFGAPFTQAEVTRKMWLHPLSAPFFVDASSNLLASRIDEVRSRFLHYQYSKALTTHFDFTNCRTGKPEHHGPQGPSSGALQRSRPRKSDVRPLPCLTFIEGSLALTSCCGDSEKMGCHEEQFGFGSNECWALHAIRARVRSMCSELSYMPARPGGLVLTVDSAWTK